MGKKKCHRSGFDCRGTREFVKRVHGHFLASGLSLGDYGIASGFSANNGGAPSALSYLFNGKRGGLYLSTAIRIANNIGVDLGEMQRLAEPGNFKIPRQRRPYKMTKQILEARERFNLALR